ncbi:MAG: hypothetical protein WAT79_08520 [Saprospiraceae bacterium]
MKINQIFNIMIGIAIGMILGFSFLFIVHDPDEKQYVPAISEPKIIFPDSLKADDFVKIVSLTRDNQGIVDLINIDTISGHKIYIPHPELLFVEVDIQKLTIYTRIDKTLHFGFRNVSEINDYLSYIFNHSNFHKLKIKKK